jgi:hypothetical protein
MKRILPAVMAMLVLGSCGNWARTGGPFEQPGQAVVLPSGWYRLQNMDYLLLTRDGPPLQSITISRLPVGVPLLNTARELSEGMLPLEAAETVLDDLSFDGTMGHLEVLESEPAVVGGLPGFRVLLSYRDRNDLAYRSVIFGVLQDRWLHLLRYAAPQRYYFDRDLSAFEAIAGSFTLR